MTTYEPLEFALKSAFDLYDYNRDGIVNVGEVLDNFEKLDYNKKHPELVDLFRSMGKKDIDYDTFSKNVKNAMNDTVEDGGLELMFSFLCFNPSLSSLNEANLKRVAEECGHPLGPVEVAALLEEAGDGKEINAETFKAFMKRKY